MNLLSLSLFCVGLVTAGVKREAGADADAEAQLLSGHQPLAVSEPECHSVPETTCVPRQVETPRKVCHQEFDEIVDTIVHEHCEEVITTTCQQVTTKAVHTKQVVGQDSKVVATGVDATVPVTVAQGAPTPGHVGPPQSVVGAPHHHPGKREAEAAADAEAHPPHPLHPAEVHESPAHISHPLCNSVPVKHCENIPTHTPRRVAHTVCAVHVDITTIEDCQEIITTKCSQTSQAVAHASNVVGHDTRVGPPELVAHHPIGPLGPPSGHPHHAVVGPISPLGPHAAGPPHPFVGPLGPGGPVAPTGYAGPVAAGYGSPLDHLTAMIHP